jgi:DNA-binding Lrp family transcriptional regulator
MGLRAYVMLEFANSLSQDDLASALRELEQIDEVDFVDPVQGPWDAMVIVEASSSVEAVARKIKKKEWVSKLEILKVRSFFERPRPWRKLDPD